MNYIFDVGILDTDGDSPFMAEETREDVCVGIPSQILKGFIETHESGCWVDHQPSRW